AQEDSIFTAQELASEAPRSSGNPRQLPECVSDKFCPIRCAMGGGMRSVRLATILAAVLALFLSLSVVACGKKKAHAAAHGEARASAPAPPTPDTTPIAKLRTPAGLLLKPERSTAMPTPSAAPAGNAKS